MKQVIHINYQGRVVPIEQSAFDLLKSYTEALSVHFENEPEKEEIIHDIKDRIAELFEQRLKKGNACITDEDVNAIINSIGKIEDLEAAVAAEEDTNPKTAKTSPDSGPRRLYRDETQKIIGGVCAGLAKYFHVDVVVIRVIAAILFFSFGVGVIPYLVLWAAIPGSSINQVVSQQKKLFRDGENKLIGGVCAGLSNYFGIDIWIPRIVFLLPFITTVFAKLWYWGMIEGFTPGTILVYIICWLVIPEAKTTSEKLAMKGEPVNMDSIQKSVHAGLKSAEKSIEEATQKLESTIKEKSPGFMGELSAFFTKIIRGLVSIILFVLKVIAYFLLVVVAIAVLASLMGVGLSSIALWELKDFVLTGDTQTYLFLATVVLFIIVPAIGLLTWIIRRIFKLQKQRAVLRVSFISAWILGWISFFLLLALVGREYKKEYASSVEEIKATPFLSDTIRVQDFYRETENEFSDNNFHLSSIVEIDSIHYEGVTIQIRKSSDEQFHFYVRKKTLARDAKAAKLLFDEIKPEYVIQDSLLLFNPRIGVSRKSKLRGQRATLVIDVPEGKFVQIPAHASVSEIQRETWYFDDFNSGEPAKLFQMRQDGLKETQKDSNGDSISPIENQLLDSTDNKQNQKSEVPTDFKSLSIPVMLFDPLGFLP